MTFLLTSELCRIEGCRRIKGHKGKHNKTPTEAWSFLEKIDSNKLDKAGYATPRGGDKNGYQNHVYRDNRVIIPFSKLEFVDSSKYQDGFIISFTPEQFFLGPRLANPSISENFPWINIGLNAFLVYRTSVQFKQYPPLKDWTPREMYKNGKISKRREGKITETGHYITRPTKSDAKRMPKSGAAQGIFAPEYAPDEINYLCQCILAWLIVHAEDSPYVAVQAEHLERILNETDLITDNRLEKIGVLRNGITCCPLCLRNLVHSDLHRMVSFDDELGNANAADQNKGATRSTIVNLFHMEPLLYSELTHTPVNMAWGHAICNTRLGQRRCYSLEELRLEGTKLGMLEGGSINTFGWISQDFEMIRSPKGSVWVRLNGDIGAFPIEMDSPEDEIHEVEGQS